MKENFCDFPCQILYLWKFQFLSPICSWTIRPCDIWKCNVSQLSCKSNKSVELGMSYSWKCPKYFKMVSSTSRRWDMIKIYFYIGPLKQRVLWSQCCLILSSKKWQILIFAENYFCRYLDKKGPKKVFFFYILSFHFSKTSLKVDLLWGLTTQSKIHVW